MISQTLKNKTTCNEPYRYRLEKIGMTGEIILSSIKISNIIGSYF
jgi:hypothetical protein